MGPWSTQGICSAHPLNRAPPPQLSGLHHAAGGAVRRRVRPRKGAARCVDAPPAGTPAGNPEPPFPRAAAARPARARGGHAARRQCVRCRKTRGCARPRCCRPCGASARAEARARRALPRGVLPLEGDATTAGLPPARPRRRTGALRQRGRAGRKPAVRPPAVAGRQRGAPCGPCGPPPLRRAPPAPASGRGRPARGRRFRPQLSQRVPSSVQKAGTGRPPPSGGKATTAGLSRAKCGQTPAGPSRVVAKPAEPARPAQDRGAAAAGAALRILPRILPESCPNPLPPPARPGRLPSLPPQRLSVRGQRPARRAAR